MQLESKAISFLDFKITQCLGISPLFFGINRTKVEVLVPFLDEADYGHHSPFKVRPHTRDDAKNIAETQTLTGLV